ncbi:MAG: sodium/proline symporter [Ruminococcaceae bacterium]|nr:sodium/proline symporter [Oscillospiraceae bacterium]
MDKILAFVLYFVAMLAIGIYFFIKSKDTDEKDYFLGGRSMGPWVTAMSAQASDMSGWLLMGFPGSILAFGMGKAWIGIGLALGTIANWLIVARRLRRFSKAADDSITLPQYLTNRFATANPALKVICAIIFLVAFTVYVASAFNAGTAVFCTVIPWFNEHKELAMIIFAAIILVYTFMGGYKAVCWTDFFQGLLMLGALLLVPIAMYTFGDFDVSYNGVFAEGITAFNANPFTADWRDIISGLGWGLGYFGMPHIIVRFMAIKKSSMVKKSSIVAITWLIITLTAAIVIAFAARTFILSNGNSLAAGLIPAGNQQHVFIEIVNDMFPGFMAGIVLSAIISASMSTADSQLLVASSSFTSDIYKPLIRKNKAGDKEVLWVGRLVVLAVTVIGLVIALSGLGDSDSWASNIMAMVENAWGLFGAAFGPVVILSLFWRRLNYTGAVAGILGGAIADIAWLILFTNTVTDAIITPTGIYEIVPGFIVGAVATVVATLLTKAPSEKVLAIYNAATDESIDD